MSIMVVMLGYLLSFILLGIGVYYDISISNFFLVNQNIALSRFMDIFAFLGSGIGVFVIVTGYLFAKKKKIPIPFWLVFGASMFITYLLKILVARQRPWQIASGFDIEASFPSGHATACFAALPFMKGKMRYVWAVFALLVVFSRIYQGYHYLTDIVAGSLIGFTIALLISKYEDKLNIERIEKKFRRK